MVEMKKLKTLSLLVLSLVVGLLPTYAQAASPRLWVNGKYITGDVAPIVRNNRTLVPMRQVSEALGLGIEWNQEAQQALVTIDDVVYAFMPDKPYYGAGDSKVDMDTTTVVYNNRIFLPLRVIAEATGSKVSWDQTSYTAVVGEGYVPAEAPTQSSNTFEEVVVERVVDGDTIVVSGGQKVRLILVDTPETKHPKKGVEYFGKEASAYTTSQLTGKTVYLQKDVSETDRYGRLLRYVWIARPSSNNPSNDEVASLCFNATLIKNGYGKLATFPPDIKYVDLFKSLERQARQANTGLWAGGTAPEAPKPTPQKPVAKPKASAPTKTYNSNPINAPYIGNSNSGKFHKRGCRSVQKMSPHNMVGFSSRNEAIGQGYSPCGRCHP